MHKAGCLLELSETFLSRSVHFRIWHGFCSGTAMKLSLLPVVATLVATASGCAAANSDIVDLDGPAALPIDDTVAYVLSVKREVGGGYSDPGALCLQDCKRVPIPVTIDPVDFLIEEVTCTPGCDASFKGRSVFVTGRQLGDATLTIEYSKEHESSYKRYTVEHTQQLRFVQADAVEIYGADSVKVGQAVRVCAEVYSNGERVAHSPGVFGIVGVPTEIHSVDIQNHDHCKDLTPLEPGPMTVAYSYKGLKATKPLSVLR
jgi:hypothetical protein